jgi:hypothetical protein
VYYWKVEAQTSGNIVITTSAGRTFTVGKMLYIPIVRK